MPFKIVRNDITMMNTEAIVNTANDKPMVGTGCDFAVYNAAGYDELLSYRREKIGPVKEGEVFVTPGFHLPAKYIIHAVSPLYIDGSHREEERLRSCYRKSLALAASLGIRSIAFPLISTGGFGYPKEEGMRIAVDEIHAFLLHSDMQIFLVVFDEKATRMGRNLTPDLEAYIDRNYVQEKFEEEYDATGYAADNDAAGYSAEYGGTGFGSFDDDAYHAAPMYAPQPSSKDAPRIGRRVQREKSRRFGSKQAESVLTGNTTAWLRQEEAGPAKESHKPVRPAPEMPGAKYSLDEDFAIKEIERKLAERMKHMSDTFPEYLLYLIREKGLTNADVYKRAIVDKKVFSKIKNNPEYHPQKLTALCLCIGAKLNMDEARDLLARAGYALSPCDKTDIIFSYFIEHGIYDMIELDIQLEEHGLPCIIT